MHGQTNAFSRHFATELRKQPTDAERMLWQKLRAEQAGVKFRRQHSYGPFILDFVCLQERVVVEIDGSQHMTMTDEDAERSRSLEKAGFRVLRFWNNEVLNEIDGVLESIYRALNSSHDPSHPNPP